MKRARSTWLGFGLCAAILTAGMGWMTLTAMRLDRAGAEARRQAALEESVRLALWRMDSAVSAILARESARPYFAYTAFSPAERAYTRMFAEIRRGDVLVPSPVLAVVPEHVLVHFQVGPDGEVTSPQVPLGNMRDLAETSYTTHERIETSAARLGELRGLLSRDTLLALLPREDAAGGDTLVAAALTQAGDSEPPTKQMLLSSQEWRARASNSLLAQSARAAPPGDIAVGPMAAVWAGDALLLARRVRVNGAAYVQGCRLDWPHMRHSFLAGIADLLPQADLVPAPPGLVEPRSRMLSALPVRLVAGDLPDGVAPAWSPIRLSLLLAWGSALLAGAAVFVLLQGAVALSERRADFVSAVTHELRTPLTTFRLYTEMLAEGMVPDEATRTSYLQTLRAEADRLGHLVENVLAYARLERGRRHGEVMEVELDRLLDGMVGRLSDRARQAGMELVLSFTDGAKAGWVSVCPSAVEQVLLNLVDNACKYAASAEDRRIHLDVGRTDDKAMIAVSDHGPGVRKSEARRVFQPFRKSAQVAANSAPGVGLGLALSRRLAADAGGRLDLADFDGGACFVLTLPLTDCAGDRITRPAGPGDSPQATPGSSAN